jgi:hypothetical protein
MQMKIMARLTRLTLLKTQQLPMLSDDARAELHHVASDKKLSF